jgi:hypothetical protein
MVQHSGFYGRDDSYYPANSNSSTPKNRQLVPKVMPANPTKVGYMGVRLWFVRRFGAFGGVGSEPVNHPPSRRTACIKTCLRGLHESNDFPF